MKGLDHQCTAAASVKIAGGAEVAVYCLTLQTFDRIS